MSVKAKNLNIGKIVAEFNKCDIDEKIRGFHELKGILTKEILDRAKDYEEKSNKYLNIAEEIKK